MLTAYLPRNADCSISWQYDILLALDSGDLAMLTLLDLSAAFDGVDHDTLLKRLQSCKRLTVLAGRC